MKAENTNEYCIFVFKRGNSFNGHKLNDDGSIIYTIKRKIESNDYDHYEKVRERVETIYVETIELTIEHKYGEESNSQAYDLLSSKLSNGDVLRIRCEIDGEGSFTKRIEKVMDKQFCENTKRSWDEIKEHWFRSQEASDRIEKHIKELI